MEGGASGFPFPRTVEEVFRDFRGRRSGLLKALTTDVDKFFAECDPEKENLCLFGFRNETWAVNMPVEEVPPEVPEPALGINFARDGMEVRDWLSLVAVHSDAWLLAVAFYYGARFGFDKKDRKRLFKMINDLPTLFEIVTGKATVTPNNSNKGKPSGKMQHRLSESQIRGPQGPQRPPQEAKDDSGEGEDDEQGATLCGACGDTYANDEFWICCDVCEKWFHGACVKITPAKAEHINHYKCPACSNKRVRA